MNDFKKVILYVIMYALAIVIVYVMVMHGPDKSISAAVHSNKDEIAELRSHVALMSLQLNVLEAYNKKLQNKCDSLIQIELENRKPLEIRLDSLIRARSPNAVARIPKKALR